MSYNTPGKVLSHAIEYALKVPDTSMVGQLAISFCYFHDINPYGYSRQGILNWQQEIASAVVRDAFLQQIKGGQ